MERWIFTVAIFFAVILGLWRTHTLEKKIDPNNPGDRKDILFDPIMLPIMISFSIFLLLDEITGSYFPARSPQIISLLITISLYYSLLVLLMPWLRRVFRPKACATFWVLPNILYVSAYLNFNFTPLIYLPFPVAYLSTVLKIWLAGFLIVMAWQIFQHIWFRKRIIRQAKPIASEATIQLWQDSLRRHDISRDISLMSSSEIASPITIGLFERSMVLLLPETSYTSEDLKLIFSHEARHLMRLDSRNKFLVAFCTALTWFNPFSWLARKKVSQDMELSNDEAVLQGADEVTRRRYAELILDSSDCSPGFTTCLSASAEGVRYRLKNIMQPQTKWSGMIVIVLVTVIFGLSLGSFGLIDRPKTLQEIFMEDSGSIAEVLMIKTEGEDYQPIIPEDKERLFNHIASLKVRQVSQAKNRFFRYPGTEEPHMLIIFSPQSDGSYALGLVGQELILSNPTSDVTTYYHFESLDWDELLRLIET